MNGGLVVMHVDGLSSAALAEAVAGGRMPAVKRLLEEEDYEILPYHCGVPSTTPFAQAGILYGDNSEIPGFRWWDRKAGAVIGFGAKGTFKQVAHRYFRGLRPLCEGGACIAACYPAGAAETFGLTYRDSSHGSGDRTAADTVLPWLRNPLHLADMLGHGAQAVGRTLVADLEARARGQLPARSYVISEMLEEVFLHHLTRYAARRAMDSGYPSIYAAFYAYDETGHAFGPEDGYTRAMLRHVDHSVASLADRRENNDSGRRYELVVLSDHGQIETTPIRALAGAPLGELISRSLPGCRVEDKSGAWGPKDDPKTHVLLAHSGGLSHLYFTAFPDRLGYRELAARFPHLPGMLAGTPGVGLLLGREGEQNVLLSAAGELTFGRAAGAAAGVLGRYGEPELLARQLDRLNSFQNSGDLLLIGAWDGRRQANFEDQAGGHGSIGGAQADPFLLVRRSWKLDTSAIEGAHAVHPLLMSIRRSVTGS